MNEISNMIEIFKMKLDNLDSLTNAIKIYSYKFEKIKNTKNSTTYSTTYFQNNYNIDDVQKKLLSAFNDLQNLLTWFQTVISNPDPMGLVLYKQYQDIILYAVQCLNEEENEFYGKPRESFEELPEYIMIYKALDKKDYEDIVMRLNGEHTSSRPNSQGKTYRFTSDDANYRVIIRGDIIQAQNDIDSKMGRRNKIYENAIEIIVGTQPIADNPLILRIN